MSLYNKVELSDPDVIVDFRPKKGNKGKYQIIRRPACRKPSKVYRAEEEAPCFDPECDGRIKYRFNGKG